MAEATTYQNITREEKARTRASIREMLDEMERLHQENQQRQVRIDLMDKSIEASFANIDAVLARLAAS